MSTQDKISLAIWFLALALAVLDVLFSGGILGFLAVGLAWAAGVIFGRSLESDAHS